MELNIPIVTRLTLVSKKFGHVTPASRERTERPHGHAIAAPIPASRAFQRPTYPTANRISGASLQNTPTCHSDYRDALVRKILGRCAPIDD
jgi:hypothetical protein